MDLITNNTVLTFLHLDVDILPSKNAFLKFTDDILLLIVKRPLMISTDLKLSI